jgi:RHS repeat-associated protein
MAQDTKPAVRDEGAGSIAPPIALPKGGGAIRGIGDKFAANPVSGSGSVSVPIALSANRSGFTPELALTYDSSSGNGPYGFGWSMRVPQITRKTDKGLPRYNDAGHSDTFILSGAEDLVPILDTAGNIAADRATAPGQTIHRYRPRIEGLFARIERWTRDADGDVHWRSLSKDNIVTLYGFDARSRIADPDDPSRVFTWLVCETRDDRGNAWVYEYKPEDGAGVDVTRLNERNRGAIGDPRRTANRYLKCIRYGNRVALLDQFGERPLVLTPQQVQNADWMFEVVLDYGEHDKKAPTPQETGVWSYRNDPFSSFRSGFEVRTTRLCRRVLMFHHFQQDAAVGVDCLVRSTDFTYSQDLKPLDTRNPIYSFLKAVTQVAYRRVSTGYASRGLPAVEFEYTEAVIQDAVDDVDAASLDNLPIGADGSAYQWIDLHGEGIPGLLTEQGGAWFYKRNISPISDRPVEFTPTECVALRPNTTLAGGRAQFMDLAGDGLPDLVILAGDAPGLYEHDEAEGWNAFLPFSSRLSREMRDRNVRFVDLDGDGHADLLITEDDAFVWHASLAEAGFGAARRVSQALDEERGPRLVFADGTQSIYLADMTGDGLTDLVRLRNGDCSYWPNLGYGRFGARVAMDGAPLFEAADDFDQRRIRLADIDGTGTADIIYLHRDGIRLYFNQSGNSWGAEQALRQSPRVDDVVRVHTADLFGNGTMCLVWSSPLARDDRRQMRYVDLMGGQKPHLLIRSVNNLGAETRVEYAPSTKFYLRDKYSGRPWITRLPFPTHVVERVVTYDYVSRNRFTTRYDYHHGYFDGVEREFRGFGMVEQTDTEELAALTGSGSLPPASNLDPASIVPPVLTKTWYHTGVYVGRDHVSDYYAGLSGEGAGEYYREPGLTDARARAMLLPDTVLPGGLTTDEEREACRALKGMMLRQEVYALDGSARADVPYTVVEQNFTVRKVQDRGGNAYGVFFTHPHETITYHYERNASDPRVQHALILDVGEYGDVLKEAAVGYGRRQLDASLLPADQAKQARTLVTYTERRVTKEIEDVATIPHARRAPLPCATCTYELTGYAPSGLNGRFVDADFVKNNAGVIAQVFDNEIEYEDQPTLGRQRRVIEHVRTLYRPNDLGVAANDPLTLLPLETVDTLATTGEQYKLAFTRGLLSSVFVRTGQALLPNPATVLAAGPPDGGGYVLSDTLKADGRFPSTDPNGQWWVPSGRIFLSPQTNDTATQELAHARSHFFLPHRMRDAFHTSAASTERFITYDGNALLPLETCDAVENRITVGERLPNGKIDAAKPGHDYRVLQPWRVMDANRNRMEVAFDIFGMVVGTAVCGKPEENLGDSLVGFDPDLTDAVALAHLNDPLNDPAAVLGHATTRLIYDLFAYQRTKFQSNPQAAVVYTISRATHDVDLAPGDPIPALHAFTYSDGFAREIQKKALAEVGPLPQGPQLVTRWAGSGWIVYNNKGKPVRQYEPFFSGTQQFEFGASRGVSSALFYDPLNRVVATLHPNDSYEKSVFTPWQHITWDANDTVRADPRNDPDIGDILKGYFDSLAAASTTPWQTWYAQRIATSGTAEFLSAKRTEPHHATPSTAYFDTLGRPFLTVAHNGFRTDASAILYATRTELDIEGNQRAVRDALVQAGDQLGRIVVRYDYDLLGHRIHQLSMEAGARWMLNDVAGTAIRAWDSRGHAVRTEYDPVRRPVRTFVVGADATQPNQEWLTERQAFGEQHPNGEQLNLRGKLCLHLDQAGAVAIEAIDFKGNTLASSRRIASEYKKAIDWAAADAALPTVATMAFKPAALEAALLPQLTAEVFSSGATYDALNRVMTATTPHTAAMKPNLVRHAYNEAGLLERVDVNLRGAIAGTHPIWTPFVVNIDYDAKGRRESIEYENGVISSYGYDPLTFRLVSLVSRRDRVKFPNDCPTPRPIGWPGCQMQNLNYTYDPVGNLIQIRDDAQQIIFFRNRRVEPSAQYKYDPLYRLIEATGREHLGQVGGGSPIPHSSSDAPRVGIDWSQNDGTQMGTYIESYEYDEVGNFLAMVHDRTDAVVQGWVRNYTYAETSLVEDGTGGSLLKMSNRLSRTDLNGGAPAERYVYDAHGNMTRMPHLGGGVHPAPNLHWDYRDQLRQADLVGAGAAYYTYDAAGQRVRKIWDKQNPAGTVDERLYLGGFEIFRRRQGTQQFERETLHVMDDKQPVALVETRTIDTAGADKGVAQLSRYQFGNHLVSAVLELDDRAAIISYEEYSPYGSTTYQAVRSQTETPKRYRYTGKERDEETRLCYHTARYYAPWLGRWASTDPEGLVDGPNSYLYAKASPVGNSDPHGRKTSVKDFLRDVWYGLSRTMLASQAAEHEQYFRDSAFLFGPGTGTYSPGAMANFYAEVQESVPPPPDTIGGKIGSWLPLIASIAVDAHTAYRNSPSRSGAPRTTTGKPASPTRNPEPGLTPRGGVVRSGGAETGHSASGEITARPTSRIIGIDRRVAPTDEAKSYPSRTVRLSDSIDPGRRMSPTKKMKDTIRASTPRTATGGFVSSTGRPVEEGEYDFGHTTGNELWRDQLKVRSGTIRPEDFRRKQRDPSMFQIEHKQENRSHINESQ